MRLKAHLCNVAFEAALVLGLAAPALSQQVPPLTDRQKAFPYLIGPGQHPGNEAFKEVPSSAVLGLAFDQWPLPGIDYDPDIVRSVVLIADTQFDRAAGTFHAVTHIHGGFKKGTPNILTEDYINKEHAAFGPILINSLIMPVDTATGANVGISIEAHEATHALHDRRLALTELLGLLEPEPLENIGQSRMSGHGPALEALLQKGESPEETELRHQHLQAVKDNRDPNSDYSAALEYPLFYTEIRSYLLEAMVAPVAAHVWTRLPQNRGELWAAFANIVGETPQGDNEVSRFLAMPEGVAATRDFPLILDGPAAQNGRTWLQRGYDAIKPAQKADYFTQVLPEIYGELLEDLGDPQGMVKMGLAPSPLHAFAFADHLIDPGKGMAPWTAAEWDRPGAAGRTGRLRAAVRVGVNPPPTVGPGRAFAYGGYGAGACPFR